MSSPRLNACSDATTSSDPNDRLVSDLEMAERTPDDGRVDLQDEPVLGSWDEENQTGHVEEVVGEMMQSFSRDKRRGQQNSHGTAEQFSEPENLAEMEIRSRVWMEKAGNEVFREALETWQAKDKMFARRVDNKKALIPLVRNEMYQFLGFYSVFQTVLLTLVAQSTFLTCHNCWISFSLSLTASVGTVAAIYMKYRSIIALELTISSEALSRMVCINRVRSLLQQRGKFSFRTHAKDPYMTSRPQTKLWLSAAIVVFILLVLSSLFLASFYQILCQSGPRVPAPGAPSP